jgi:hypothetical protein
MTEKIFAVLLLWMPGLILAGPGLLIRFGVWKTWYLAPVTPFTAKPMVLLGIPFSLFFWCMPIIALLPIDDDTYMRWIAIVGVIGTILGIVIADVSPGWAKPTWQRRLEERYSKEEINEFLQVWRKMDQQEWARLIGTDEGLEELVRIARGPYRA